MSKKKINQGLYILNIILVDFHMLKYPNFLKRKLNLYSLTNMKNMMIGLKTNF